MNCDSDFEEHLSVEMDAVNTLDIAMAKLPGVKQFHGKWDIGSFDILGEAQSRVMCHQVCRCT